MPAAGKVKVRQELSRLVDKVAREGKRRLHTLDGNSRNVVFPLVRGSRVAIPDVPRAMCSISSPLLQG